MDAYKQYKKELNAKGFSDLLHHTVRLLTTFEDIRASYHRRFKYILVDEMQDTNIVQLELLKQLAGPETVVSAVGDGVQSIYGWCGARVKNMLEFPEVFPGTKTIYLEKNYRSTKTILDIAHCVISQNQKRYPKRLWTDNSRGKRAVLLQCATEGAEAAQVARWVEKLR